MSKRKPDTSFTFKNSKKSKTLCECCGILATNILNHLHNNNECQEWYTAHNHFFVPSSHLCTSQLNVTDKSSQNQPTIYNNNTSQSQPKVSHTMFGRYRAIPEMEITDNLSDDLNNNIFELDSSSSNPNSDNIEFLPSDENLDSINHVLDYSSVSIEMLQKQQEHIFDPMTLVSMKLFKILSKANSPLYLYDQIYEFIKQTYPIMKTLNKKQLKKRTKLLKILYTTILNGSDGINDKHLEFNLFPIIKRTTVTQSSIPIHIATFDIKSLIVSLLLDPLAMKQSNLLMHDPAYQHPDQHNQDTYGDIHTGYWFRNAHNNLCTSDSDLLCPLIFFIDGVSLDNMQRQTLEPVSFTLGIFNRKARNSSIFWRILGYVPNLEKMFNLKYSKSQSKHESLKKTHYHQLLNVIFNDLDKLQKQGGMTWTFGNGKIYTLKFPIMYIIGDALGLDKLCNRKLNYIPTKTFMTGCCRDCNSVYKHCHDPDYICHYHKTNTLFQLPDKIKNAMSYVPMTINALSKLCFGGDRHGLVGCCPPEPLHQWYLGVVELIIEYFWSRITVRARDYLDNVIRGISIECYRQSDRQMPNIHQFKN